MAGGYTNVLTLGDNMQSDPSPTGFATVFDSTWGRVKPLIHPEAGNHDYGYSGAKGYYGYFGAAAGDPTKGYYSFDIGAWHLVALNSNCSKIAGGCAFGGAQELWLKADLAAHPGQCILAYEHHPRYSSGHDGDNTFMSDLYQDLYNAGADLLLSGHSHDYERFNPQDNAAHLDTAHGITQFVVGTGGAFFTGLGTRHPNSVASQNSTFGVLALTLHPTSYDLRFQPEAGKTWTDSGSRACHAAGTQVNDFSMAASPATLSVTAGQATSTTITTTVTSGAAQNVALSATGLPAGASASFSPATITAGQTSTMTITTATTTPAATSTVTVTGTGTTATHTTTLALTVTGASQVNDFSVAASPATQSVTAGQATSTTITTTVTSGAAQNVALSATGLPAGASASFSPATITAGQTSTMTITTATTTPAATSTVTVTGTGTTATHTTTLALTVTNGSVATPRLVQSGGASETTAATSLTARFPATTGAGHLLVLAAGVYTGATNKITSVTDSAGNTWTRIGAYAVSGHYSDGELWYAANAQPTSSVTARTASSAMVAMQVSDYSGVATTNPLDAATGTSATGTTAASGSVVPTTANELTVGFIAGHGNSQAISFTTPGLTALAQMTSVGSTTTSVCSGYLVAGAGGPESATGTFGSGMYWAAGIAVFRPA